MAHAHPRRVPARADNRENAWATNARCPWRIASSAAASGGPRADLWDCPQGGPQIPIGQIGKVDLRHGPVVVREALHRRHAERPNELEPRDRDVGDRIAHRRVFPIDDGGEATVSPQQVPGPEVAVQKHRRIAPAQRPGVCQDIADPRLRQGHIGRLSAPAQHRRVVVVLTRQKGEGRIGPVDGVNAGEVQRKLAHVRIQIRRRRVGLSLDIFDDQVGRRQDLAALVDTAGRRHRQAGHSQDPQRLEFVRRDPRIPHPVHGAVLPHHKLPGAAVRTLDFERRHRCRVAARQRPYATQPALGVEPLDKPGERRIVARWHHSIVPIVPRPVKSMTLGPPSP